MLDAYLDSFTMAIMILIPHTGTDTPSIKQLKIEPVHLNTHELILAFSSASLAGHPIFKLLDCPWFFTSPLYILHL